MMTHNYVAIPLIILAAMYLAGRNKPRHLLALAILGFAVVYGPVAVGRLQVWNVFHYYLGAKYIRELGYYNIYNCAVHFSEPGWVDFDTVRNLHRYSYEPIYYLPGCPMSNFTPARLHEFATDIQWLHDRPTDKSIDELWPAMFRDKGLNTTPYWLAFAMPLANIAPVGGVRFWLLLYADFGLLIAGLLIAGRHFGLERTALAAIFLLTWPGTYPNLMGHWFQYAWLFAVLAAVATYWTRPGVSGAMLATAAALRIFPGVLFLMPLLHRKHTPKAFWTGTALAGAGWAFAGWMFGIPLWVEFVQKMSQHSGYILREPGNLGLRNLIYTLADWPGAVANWSVFATGEGALAAGPDWLGWAAMTPMAIIVGGVVYNGRKRRFWRFSDALPALFGVLVLSRYYYAVNVIYALELPAKRTRHLLLISLLFFATSYGLHPVIGYLAGQVALLLFYWRQIEWA